MIIVLSVSLIQLAFNLRTTHAFTSFSFLQYATQFCFQSMRKALLHSVLFPFLIFYCKPSFPMTPHVRLLVGLLVVCHNFLPCSYRSICCSRKILDLILTSPQFHQNKLKNGPLVCYNFLKGRKVLLPNGALVNFIIEHRLDELIEVTIIGNKTSC